MGLLAGWSVAWWLRCLALGSSPLWLSALRARLSVPLGRAWALAWPRGALGFRFGLRFAQRLLGCGRWWRCDPARASWSLRLVPFLGSAPACGCLGGLGSEGWGPGCRPARLAVVVRAFVLCPALLQRGWCSGGAGAGAGPLLQLGPPLLHAARLTVGHPGSAVRYRTVLLLGNMLQRSPLA